MAQRIITNRDSCNHKSFVGFITICDETAPMSTTGQRIKQLRESKGLSQRALAELCGWSDGQNRISMYETDRRVPSAEDANRLGDALGSSGAAILFELVTQGESRTKQPSAKVSHPLVLKLEQAIASRRVTVAQLDALAVILDGMSRRSNVDSSDIFPPVPDLSTESTADTAHQADFLARKLPTGGRSN